MASTTAFLIVRSTITNTNHAVSSVMNILWNTWLRVFEDRREYAASFPEMSLRFSWLASLLFRIKQ